MHHGGSPHSRRRRRASAQVCPHLDVGCNRRDESVLKEHVRAEAHVRIYYRASLRAAGSNLRRRQLVRHGVKVLLRHC